MKTILTSSILQLVTSLVMCWSLRLQAQGVHLSAGESLVMGFNGVDGCQFTEGTPATFFGVFFGNDLLGPSESLRLEMFEDNPNEPPLATQLHSPAPSVSFVQMYGPAAWLDYQGVIRLTMLYGSVDVNYSLFIVGPNANTLCYATVYAVPEPSAILVMFLGCGIGTGVRIFRRR